MPPPTSSATPVCDLCGAPMQAGLTPWHFCCPGCSLERSTLQPQINSLHSLDEAQRATALKTLRNCNFAQLLAWLAQQCRWPAPQGLPDPTQRPQLLEVGCAHGWFLQQAQQHYEVQGIEPDQPIASSAQAQGLPVRQGFFPQALGPQERFDIIVFNDVLEHIPNICQVLQHCHQHLNAGGYLVINAPDSHGIFYQLSKKLAKIKKYSSFERMWQKGLPSPHLYYFNTSSIQKLATAQNFQLKSFIDLPSVSLAGLRERIGYTQTHSSIKTFLMYHTIRILLPWIQAQKPDIHVWLLQKK